MHTTNLSAVFLLLTPLILANTQGYVECDPRDPNDRSVGMGEAGKANILDYINDLKDDGDCTIPPSDDMDGGVADTPRDVGARGNCGRTTCGNTSGVWLCNETNSTLTVDCNIVANLALQVYYTCGVGVGTYKGHTQGKYSVYIGYANCDLSSEYGPFYQSNREIAYPGDNA